MLLVAAALIGALLGLLGGQLANRLPSRYGCTQLESKDAQRRRNVALYAWSSAVSFGIAWMLSSVPDLRFGTALMLFGVNAVVAALLLTGAAVDLEHMILPNEITLGAAAICLLSAPFRSVGFKGSVIGAVVAGAFIFGSAFLYKRVRKRSGSGFGDAKLALAAGAWHGLDGAAFVIFFALLQQVLAALVMRAFGVSYRTPASVEAELAELRASADAGDDDARAMLADDPMANAPAEGTLGMRLPLGPFLALACIEVLFLRRWLIAHVLAWLLE